MTSTLVRVLEHTNLFDAIVLLVKLGYRAHHSRWPRTVKSLSLHGRIEQHLRS